MKKKSQWRKATEKLAKKAVDTSSKSLGKFGSDAKKVARKLDEEHKISEKAAALGKATVRKAKDLDDRYALKEKSKAGVKAGIKVIGKAAKDTKKYADKKGITKKVVDAGDALKKKIVEPVVEWSDETVASKKIGKATNKAIEGYGKTRAFIKQYYAPETPDELLQTTTPKYEEYYCKAHDVVLKKIYTDYWQFSFRGKAHAADCELHPIGKEKWLIKVGKRESEFHGDIDDAVSQAKLMRVENSQLSRLKQIHGGGWQFLYEGSRIIPCELQPDGSDKWLIKVEIEEASFNGDLDAALNKALIMAVEWEKMTPEKKRLLKEEELQQTVEAQKRKERERQRKEKELQRKERERQRIEKEKKLELEPWEVRWQREFDSREQRKKERLQQQRIDEEKQQKEDEKRQRKRVGSAQRLDWRCHLDNYEVYYLYHITHIDNLESILEHGILSHNNASMLPHHDISEQTVNERRALCETVYKRSIHSYVPLYFNPLNPMLYLRRRMQKDLVILSVDRELLFNNEILVTDGNAASHGTEFMKLDGLHSINWGCVFARYWADIPDGKRMRCAEALIPEEIMTNHIQSINCNNSILLNRINTWNSTSIPVQINAKLFF